MKYRLSNTGRDSRRRKSVLNGRPLFTLRHGQPDPDRHVVGQVVLELPDELLLFRLLELTKGRSVGRM